MRRADSRGRARRAPGAGCGHLHPPRGAGPRSPEVYATDRIPALGTGPRPWSGGRGRWSSGGWRPRAKKPDHIDIGVAPLTEEWTGAGGVRFDTTPPPVGEESNLTFDTISPVRRALSATTRAFPTSEARPAYSHGATGSISTLLRCSERTNSVKGGHENSTRPVTERDARRPGARGRVPLSKISRSDARGCGAVSPGPVGDPDGSVVRRATVHADRSRAPSRGRGRGRHQPGPRGPWRRPATARPAVGVGRRRGNGSAEQRWVSRLADRPSWSGG